MTEDERAIWNAAYAAALVADFEVFCRAQAFGGGFDRAKEIATAERAIEVANHAVRELRRWRRHEDPDAGVSVL